MKKYSTSTTTKQKVYFALDFKNQMLRTALLFALVAFSFIYESSAQTVNTTAVNIHGTTDLCSSSSCLGTYVSPPVGPSSYRGGTYAAANPAIDKEIWGFNISGLTSGTTYSVKLYYLATDALGGDTNRRGDLSMKNSTASVSTTGTIPLSSYNQWFSIDVEFTATQSTDQLQIEADGSGNNGHWLYTAIASNGVVAACSAGSNSPNLSTTSISNSCPSSTVNLNSITASNTPSGASLTWHTGTPATNGNKIASPGSVSAGTYYAAFFDSANNCYSGTNGNGTSQVTATVTSCCNAGTSRPDLTTTSISNTCPSTTVDLTSITATNQPAGTILTWHTANPATNANKVANPSSVGAGSYRAAFFDSANNCYSGTTTDGNRTRTVTVTSVACCAAGVDAPKF